MLETSCRRIATTGRTPGGLTLDGESPAAAGARPRVERIEGFELS